MTVWYTLKGLDSSGCELCQCYNEVGPDLRNCSFNHEADAIQSSSTIPQYAIITPTSKIVSQLEFQPPLSFLKQNALQNVYYFNSAKVFLNFKKPFWTSSDDGNRVPPISYEDDGNTENVKNGGGCVRFSLFIKIFFTISSCSDDLLKQSYYPSHTYHGNSILASYTWEKDAEFFSALTDIEIVNHTLRALTARHGEVVMDNFDHDDWENNSAIQRWDLDNHFHAAFLMYGVNQRNEFLEELLKPHGHGNLIFAGESSNKVMNDE